MMVALEELAMSATRWEDPGFVVRAVYFPDSERWYEPVVGKDYWRMVDLCDRTECHHPVHAFGVPGPAHHLFDDGAVDREEAHGRRCGAPLSCGCRCARPGDHRLQGSSLQCRHSSNRKDRAAFGCEAPL